jgi:hypothetical protein
MKKILAALLLITTVRCSNNTDKNAGNDTTNTTYDESKPDTNVRPNGLNNSSVISTDTSAYKVPDSLKNK